MPKDFVFVDLLPVKSQEEEMAGLNDLASVSSSASASNSGSLPPSPTSDDDSIFSTLDSATMLSDLDCSVGGYIQDTQLDTRPELGLGIMNMDFGMGWQSQEAAPGAAELAQFSYASHDLTSSASPQIENFGLDTTHMHNAAVTHPRGHKRAHTVGDIATGVPALKRSKSSGDRRKSGEIQFKAYQAPVAGPRKQFAHKHTMSAPVVPQVASQPPAASNLEDFMLLNEQITVFLNDSDVSESSDYSPGFVPEVDNKLSHGLKGCSTDQFLTLRPGEFDFNSFVTF